MKKILIFLTIPFAAAFSGLAQAASSQSTKDVVHNESQNRALTPAQREVWQVIEEWNAAFTENDADRYFQFIDEDITVLTPSNPYRVEGLADDRDEFEYGIRIGYSRVGLFQEIAPIIRVYDDFAYVTYFNRGFYGPPDSGQMAYLKETTILRQVEGVWKIIHIHVSK